MDGPREPVSGPIKTSEYDLSPPKKKPSDFLKRFGQRLCCRIPVAGGPPEVLQGDVDQQTQGRDHNYYFHACEVRPGLGKKATKSDVVSCSHLWVDCDVEPCPPGRDSAKWLQAEQARILDSIRAFPKPPSVIVYSGGGYQAYWKLKEAFKGDWVAEVESRNKEIARTLTGGDSCHSIDHVMRLPYTFNVPSEKKREKNPARKIEEATVVEWREAQYRLEDFPRQEGPRHSPEPQRVEFPADLPTLGDDLIEGLNAACELYRLEDYAGDRSRWQHAISCKWAREGLPREEHLAALLDPRVKVSHAILTGPNGEQRGRKHAERQVRRAEEAVSADESGATSWLEWMNARHFMIREGKTMLYYEEAVSGDDFKLFPMTHSTFREHLRPRCEEIGVNGKNISVEWSQLWVKDAQRRYYPYGFVLDPKAEHEGKYNLWKGFGVKPKEGKWDLLRAHIRNLAGGDEGHAAYVEKWLAWKFQHPEELPRVALVFTGGEGTGKNMFFDAVSRIFGVHGLVAADIDYICGRFNSHLRHKCFVFANEATTPSEENMGRFKALITDRVTSYEAKNVDRVEGDNHVGMVITSNSNHVVKASQDARRFAVFNVREEWKDQPSYFEPLAREINERGGLAAMLHELLYRDLGKWHPSQNRPNTQALSEQKAHGLRSAERFLFDCLREGHMPWYPDTRGKVCGFKLVGKDTYHVHTSRLTDFLRYWYRRDDVTLNQVADAFKRLRFEKLRGRPKGFVLPPLPEARKAWDQNSGIPWEWGTEQEWEVDCYLVDEPKQTAPDDEPKQTVLVDGKPVPPSAF